MAPKPSRQYCRFCSALAGFTRNICDGCFEGEMYRQEREAAPRTWTPRQRMNRAYQGAVIAAPLVEKR